jgi:hypothetical protein
VDVRYPLEDLVAASGLTEHGLAKRVGLKGTSLRRAREMGLTADAADRYAVRAGLHPLTVWPSMVEEAKVECAAEDCPARFVPSRQGHRYCTPTCRERVGERRRYQSNPERAARKREARRRYYEEAGDYERAQRRREYWANPERFRAERRERYRRSAA